jgi:hypothetical protein
LDLFALWFGGDWGCLGEKYLAIASSSCDLLLTPVVRSCK